jgi:NAD(P)-dependent dehydrogenase (short-subunit alcohol dehydrogenase family)
MSSNTLVTGANRGIGLEFVRQYAEAGWHVYACCRKPEDADELHRLASKYKGLVTVHALDVGNFDQIHQLAKQLSGITVDLLINNAGIYGHDYGANSSAIDEQAWIQSFRVNSIAPLKMVEAFTQNITCSKLKKIANLTSKMGSVDDNTSGGYYLYRSSKAALNMVTKSLSLDLAPLGISVALLHPGWVQTDMGGPNALISVEQSVAGMRKVLEKLAPATSGKFYAYDGKEIPW